VYTWKNDSTTRHLFYLFQTHGLYHKGIKQQNWFVIMDYRAVVNL